MWPLSSANHCADPRAEAHAKHTKLVDAPHTKHPRRYSNCRIVTAAARCRVAQRARNVRIE
eukprot:gene9792-biopygen4888